MESSRMPRDLPRYEDGSGKQFSSGKTFSPRSLWRIARGIASRFSNRRFYSSLAILSILAAKTAHIYSHHDALSKAQLHRWGYTFYGQDFVVILLLRQLFDTSASNAARPIRLLSMAVASFLTAIAIALGAINVTFFFLTGSEIHWRNIAVAGDASGRALILSGTITFVIVASVFLVSSYILQDVLFLAAGLALDMVKWPFKKMLACVSQRIGVQKYTAINNDDGLSLPNKLESDEEFDNSASRLANSPRLRTFVHGAVGFLLVLQIILSALRPNDDSLAFFAWTSLLLPMVDMVSKAPSLYNIYPFYGNSIKHTWDTRTALADHVSFSWLPEEPKLAGFHDWYNGTSHYNATLDPLKISNLDADLIPGLRGKLKDIDIEHVMLIFLESTRKDVFPVKKDGLVWNKLESTWANSKLPEDAQERLATLTPNANFLTGDYDDGFPHNATKRRGGLNFNNAHTTATYTLKSLTGTFCGLSPLIADFNLEYNHHIYQPCLPHVLEALNHVKGDGDASGFKDHAWHTNFMQSVTLDFDKFDMLMPTFGFLQKDIISKETLKSSNAKFGKVNLPDVNYFGMVEEPLMDYMRDYFETAKSKNERVFMSHITSTSHHPFGMPESEKYIPVASGHEDLSHYINAIGYDDRWLGKILNLLDEQQVADKTLIVIVGDHGLSMPENDIVSSYYNPSVGNDRVPLVVSHPKLPPIDINDAVQTNQILPTILDLLLETESLSGSHRKAVSDLLRNYEGQSLIREQRLTTPEGQGNWQFTLVNPGRAMVTVRDARQPELRLIVPVVDNVEWKFSNITIDPTEQHPVQDFSFSSFLQSIEAVHGIEVARWAEEAAFITRWWVEENTKRWRYQQFE